MAANFENLKKSLKKSLLIGIKIFTRNVIALYVYIASCVDLDEKIKNNSLGPL